MTNLNLGGAYTGEELGAWKVDRSRYLTGLQECLMKRYLNYHAGPTGYGWSPPETIHQVVGNMVHDHLSRICKVAWYGGKEGQLQFLRGYLSIKRAEFGGKHLNTTLQGNVDRALEQWCLIEGLTWAWFYHALPLLQEKWDLLSSEEELTFLESGVLQMTRPDLLLMNKVTGEVSNHDFKTSNSKLNDNYVKSWFTALQMAIGCYAASKSLNKPVKTFYIHALQKGGVGEFKAKGSTGLGWDQQYSHLCYANFSDPMPPVTDTTTIDFSGYWYKKTPVWTAHIVGLEPGMSNVEYVAKNLPLKVLNEIFGLLGPYEVKENQLNDYLKGMPEHEGWWINTLWDLAEIESKHGWESEIFQDALSRAIPRSYNCYGHYNQACQFRDLCFRENGWKKPEHRYKVRVPHHEAELLEFKSRVKKS